MSKRGAVITKAQKDLDIAQKAAKQLSGVVTKLQRRLDRFKSPGRAESDRLLVESGSLDEGP